MEASFLYGLSLALAIGPIAILIINQSINCGTFAGILSGVGAALADLTYAFTTFMFGVYLQRQIGENNEYLKVISSVILFVLGSWMIFSSIKHFTKDKQPSRSSLFCKRPLISVYLMTIANPLTIIVFSGIAGQVASNNLLNIIACSLMLFAGSLLVQILFATLGALIRDFLFKPTTFRILNLLSGFAIVVISLKQYF